jgi:hypothetical protein
LTGSAASHTMGARGNGSDLSEIKGTFLLCPKGTFLFCGHRHPGWERRARLWRTRRAKASIDESGQVVGEAYIAGDSPRISLGVRRNDGH